MFRVDRPIARSARSRRSAVQGQGGWIGLALLLIVLVIAGWLARSALKETTGDPAPGKATAASAPVPIQRAREAEAQVLQQADDLRKRIDETSK